MKIPKTAAIIQARMNSSRFAGKILREIDGKPLLEILIDRLHYSKALGKIIVATTGSPQDDPIVAFCKKKGVDYYRGSEEDLLDRTYRAAQYFNLDTIARITSDCPLNDPEVVDNIVNFFHDNRSSYDFVANTAPPPGTYPEGMDVEVFSFKSLETAWREAIKPSDREHVTFFFWKQPERFRLHRIEAPEDWSNIRLTVDRADDLEIVEQIYRNFKENTKPVGVVELVNYVKQNEQLSSNRKHAFGEGWNASLEEDRSRESNENVVKAPPLDLKKGDEAWEKAVNYIPSGAQTFSNTPLQFVQGVAPKVILRGIGSKIWDPDGNEYIDYILGLGPAILGHSHKEVNAVAKECADNYFNIPPLPHPMEAQLAEKIVELIPCAEMVRYGKNGSDVTAAAVRVARAFTGRDVIACCGYHGWQDWYIGSTTRNLGIPKAVCELTVPFQYNKIETLEKVFQEHKDNVAGVILEPVNFVQPEDGFLQEIRELCNRYGALLIFDEIITGFRLNLGGAQKSYDVTPDIATFGKGVANGFPISILCGKRKYMMILEDVFFSFTFGGELPSIAAALKTIEILERDSVLNHIHAMGRRLLEGFVSITKELNIDYVKAIGMDFWPAMQFNGIKDYSQWEITTLFQQEMIRRRVLTRPAFFVSSAHGEYDIHYTLFAIRESLDILSQAVKSGKVRDWTDGEIIQPVIRAS